MGHDRRSENAKGEVEHVRVPDDVRRGCEPADDSAPVRVGEGDLGSETGGDDHDESDDDGFEIAESEALQRQDRKDVERCQEHTEFERDAEDEVEADGRSHDLGDVRGDNCNLCQEPQWYGGPSRISVAACLCKVAARGDGESCTKRLKHDRHDVGDQGDNEQLVSESGAAGDRGRPVSRIHVAHGDEVPRANKGRETAKGIACG